jgi:phosphatidylserine/phosphatidylglycerophosphate/cardiolipin synthase-like enzyme
MTEVIVIDGETTITGSYNLSAAANTNAENIIVIKHRPTADAYARNRQLHKSYSRRL